MLRYPSFKPACGQEDFWTTVVEALLPSCVSGRGRSVFADLVLEVDFRVCCLMLLMVMLMMMMMI